MGIIFLLFSMFFTGLNYLTYDTNENGILVYICCFIFGLVGVVLIKMGIDHILNDKKILKKGKKYIGTIVAYEDDNSIQVNGVPMLVLVVEYMSDTGTLEKQYVRTNTTREEGYPIGGSVRFCKLGEDALAIKE